MRQRALMGASALLFSSVVAQGATLDVGPDAPYATPCAAEAAANPGDVISIDPSGDYDGDVCIWDVDDLTIMSSQLDQRVHIRAAGNDAGGKGIWVIQGDDYLVEGVEFSGAAVADLNGAGIRQEGRNLTLRNSYFHDNENGILTSHDPESRIVIEYCEFANNGLGDPGYTHNIYIGHVGSFWLQFSYSHDAVEGHLVKSRAAENYIMYNRLSGESGTGSYEIDIPNGGLTYVIGNLIQQTESTHNGTLLSYRREGAHADNPSDHLFVVNNSFVNERSAGTFISVDDGITPIVVRNNVFAGEGSVTNQTGFTDEANYIGDPGFVDRSDVDYRLVADSAAIDAGIAPGTGDGYDLMPWAQYVHPADRDDRSAVGVIDIGAYEFDGGSPPTGSGTGGGRAPTSTGGATPGRGGSGPTGGGDSAGAGGRGEAGLTASATSPSDSGGCGCRTGRSEPRPRLWIFALVAICFSFRRRLRRATRTPR